MEAAGHSIEELSRFHGRGRAQAGCVQGDDEAGILPAGAAAGLVRRIQTVSEVVLELAEGAQSILQALAGLDDDAANRDGPRAA